MAKKGGKSAGGFANRGWSKVKSGGSAFKEHKVPVNTKPRKLNNRGT